MFEIVRSRVVRLEIADLDFCLDVNGDVVGVVGHPDFERVLGLEHVALDDFWDEFDATELLSVFEFDGAFASVADIEVVFFALVVVHNGERHFVTDVEFVVVREVAKFVDGCDKVIDFSLESELLVFHAGLA